MPAVLASNNMISRALNDPNLASNVAAELMSLVARKTKSKKKGKKIKAGPIVGIVIGIIVVLIILAIIIILLRKRSNKKKLQGGGQMQTM
ncbi:hypothetical protein K505DRAFT_373081 [Melanomma pulvis-pyrius CBS 109.77]|uniref:Mid2 domain-containing protein n=1 Tax=Melanomma pulvis-pyrius CBS 109.77 TaxID=1314802 RepID=A0A6A6XK45_9PLEO|nr:hypothetical protein K505DRAFT_373081 [Melanomma pulvis-pyrius CBS 109.77]